MEHTFNPDAAYLTFIVIFTLLLFFPIRDFLEVQYRFKKHKSFCGLWLHQQWFKDSYWEK